MACAVRHIENGVAFNAMERGHVRFIVSAAFRALETDVRQCRLPCFGARVFLIEVK